MFLIETIFPGGRHWQGHRHGPGERLQHQHDRGGALVRKESSSKKVRKAIAQLSHIIHGAGSISIYLHLYIYIYLF